MKTVLLLLLFTGFVMGSPQSETPKTGAMILVETVSSITSEDPVGPYGISPAGLLDIKKDREQLGLPVFGEKTTDTISVTVIGAINRPGHYFIKPSASVADLIAEAQGLPRLATSKLILR